MNIIFCKKKIIKRIFLILLFSIFYFCSNAVNAVDLKFKLMAGPEGYYRIRVFANAYQGSIDYFDNVLKGTRGKFRYVDEENFYANEGINPGKQQDTYHFITPNGNGVNTGFDYVGTSLNYSSAGIRFQQSKDPASTYQAYNGYNGYLMSYAVQSKLFPLNENEISINLNSYVYSAGNYGISAKSQVGAYKDYNAKNVTKYNPNEKTFHAEKWTINDQKISISDWLIPKSYVDSLDKSYRHQISVNLNGENKTMEGIRFSLYASVLENCYRQYCALGITEGDVCNGTDPKKYTQIKNKTYDVNTLLNLILNNSLFDIIRKPSILDIITSGATATQSAGANAMDGANPLTHENYNVRKISYTANDAYLNTTQSNKVLFDSSAYGIRGFDGQGLRSIANDYDNWLILDTVTTPPPATSGVYVRHVDYNTGELLNNLYNSSEPFYDGESDSWSMKASSGSATVGGVIYQESYTGLKGEQEVEEEEEEGEEDKDKDKDEDSKDSEEEKKVKIIPGQKIKASRSGNLIDNGVQYKYWGYKAAAGATAQEAASNFSRAGAYSNETVETDSKNQVTVITFYYYKSSDSTPDPKMYINEGSNSTSDDGCRLYNVEGGSEITPYILTKTYSLSKLKYSINVSAEGAVSYSLLNFNVNKLESAYITNSTGINYKGQNVPGNILGSAQDYLFNTSDGSLPLSGDINSELTGKYNSYSSVSSLRNVENNYGSLTGGSTSASNFTKKFTVMNNAYNGLRYMKGMVYYKEYGVGSGSVWPIGSSTAMEAGNKQFVNVANVITLGTNKVQTENFVNHTNNPSATNIIQKNAEFTVTLKSSTNDQKHLSKFYVWFDFPINYNGVQYNSYSKIEVSRAPDNKDTSFTAIATDDNSKVGDYVAQLENHMFVVGVSDNVPAAWISYIIDNVIPSNNVHSLAFSGTSDLSSYYIGKSTNSISRNDVCTSSKSILKHNVGINTNSTDLFEDIFYFAWNVTTFKTVSRIYDFKVTDCLDVNFKSVFRDSNNKNVNEHKGFQYYSGTKELKIYGSSYNVLDTRKNVDSSKILPLGPYKHTDVKYIFAPKLGYRISYDLKTSGYFNYEDSKSDRYVKVKPSYYYISKDGNTFKDSSMVNLYYKNSSGKYVKFDSSNMYAIYFTPNDGYRYLNNLDTTNNIDAMSKKLTELKISSNNGFKIDSSMMAASDNNFIQSWYGEFKLPNSTIIVQGSDVNKPLTDGYIGVKFELQCIDSDGTITSYNTQDSVKAKTAKYPANTTQWDYEGYLGWTKIGQMVDNITLQLEKGTWNIDNDMYQKIKGTVILYDTDSRAADDFN